MALTSNLKSEGGYSEQTPVLAHQGYRNVLITVEKMAKRYLIFSWTIALPFIFATVVFAEIDKSIEEFQKSSFIKQGGLVFRDSHKITDDPRFNGQYNFVFQSEDEIYKVEIIADQKGEKIAAQFLRYPLTLK